MMKLRNNRILVRQSGANNERAGSARGRWLGAAKRPRTASKIYLHSSGGPPAELDAPRREAWRLSRPLACDVGRQRRSGAGLRLATGSTLFVHYCAHPPNNVLKGRAFLEPAQWPCGPCILLLRSKTTTPTPTSQHIQSGAGWHRRLAKCFCVVSSSCHALGIIIIIIVVIIITPRVPLPFAFGCRRHSSVSGSSGGGGRRYKTRAHSSWPRFSPPASSGRPAAGIQLAGYGRIMMCSPRVRLLRRVVAQRRLDLHHTITHTTAANKRQP